MVHAIRIHEAGGPEVLKWEQVDVGAPGPGEVRLRNKAVGLNYIDTYHRSGLYKIPLPAVIGMEGAGEVTAVCSGVTELTRSATAWLRPVRSAPTPRSGRSQPIE